MTTQDLRTRLAAVLAVVAGLTTSAASAQILLPEVGSEVPPDVREMYDRGCKYLASTQREDGSWGAGEYDDGPAITGLCVLALMGSGEDCNRGPYAEHVRRGLRNIVMGQDQQTGYISSVDATGGEKFKSMYHHGFAMMCLAECHGAVDEHLLWEGIDNPEGRSVGKATELAVRLAITSQNKNPWNAWRYSPDAPEADTSVAGAVLMGLLAARNAGIEVPDTNIDKAIAYYVSYTSQDGQVAYGTDLGFDENWARPAIACLVFAVARRKDLPQFKYTLDYLKDHIEEDPSQHRDYTRYYTAQAMFQGDVDAWRTWNKLLVQRLKETQNPDGSFPSAEGGVACGSAFSLLSLALNYRLLPIYER